MLRTDMETGEGTVRLTDFVPLRDGDHSSLIRIVGGLSGSVGMAMDLCLRFDYGALPPWMTATGKGFEARVGSLQVSLEAHVPIGLGDDVGHDGHDASYRRDRRDGCGALARLRGLDARRQETA